MAGISGEKSDYGEGEKWGRILESKRFMREGESLRKVTESARER